MRIGSRAGELFYFVANSAQHAGVIGNALIGDIRQVHMDVGATDIERRDGLRFSPFDQGGTGPHLLVRREHHFVIGW